MKKGHFWVLAIIITLAAVIYQRKTGPTYDKKVKINIDNTEYNFKLIRSHGGQSDCKIELIVPNKAISGILEYRKFPTKGKWNKIEMTRESDIISNLLPHLPPAGKYEYKITLQKGDQSFKLNGGAPTLIRFKGDVPAAVLIPHIFFMFFAMLLGNLAGIMAVFKHIQFKLFTNLTIIALFIGGLILGPWVQWYAFGEAWAGIPFAWDLTDNKTLFAFIFWLIAFFTNRKQNRPISTIVACIVMLIIYSIPHSMYGSQLNPETGEIIQGWIQLYLF